MILFFSEERRSYLKKLFVGIHIIDSYLVINVSSTMSKETS